MTDNTDKGFKFIKLYDKAEDGVVVFADLFMEAHHFVREYIKALTELHDNTLDALGYTVQDDVPVDIIDSIQEWATSVLEGIGDIDEACVRRIAGKYDRQT